MLTGCDSALLKTVPQDFRAGVMGLCRMDHSLFESGLLSLWETEAMEA